MPRRMTLAQLSDRVDGLGLAFFAATHALCDALAEVHPDDTGLVDRMRDESIAMLAMLDDVDQEVFSERAISQAFTAVLAAFTLRSEEPAARPPVNDNERDS